MATKKKPEVPEWASHIVALRRRLGMSQQKFAQRLECSAMSISRWERGLQAPTAEFYIRLGKFGGECWYFWGHAGLQRVDCARALPSKQASESSTAESTEKAAPGIETSILTEHPKKIVALHLLKAVAGSHGTHGDKEIYLRGPSSALIGAPGDWCPNPLYTNLLHVRGHSMEPLIHNGDIVAVDSYQRDPSQLDNKIVLAAHEDKGLCVSRLRRYGSLNFLQAENPNYRATALGKSSGWHIVATALWWISVAP